MAIIDSILDNKKTAFSFEILPPLKGNGIEKVFQSIDPLLEFNPKYINITTHHSEFVYQTRANGNIEKYNIRKRPGTVAIAAAIQNKYGIPAVPHMICLGFSKAETEYALIDLQFLGITDVFVLRGDKGKLEPNFIPEGQYHCHAIELQEQIRLFNEGFFIDGTPMQEKPTPFTYGVAGYPEKHEESPNEESDLFYLKKKVEAGASYIVTQMFFDNQKYFRFVERCRAEGITVPIIPGIKPIQKASQLSVLPKTFRSDIPEVLAKEIRNCKNDTEVKDLGVEWCINQCKELIKFGVPSIHFYTVNATESVCRIAKEIY